VKKGFISALIIPIRHRRGNTYSAAKTCGM
jgi:hypothetical protein